MTYFWSKTRRLLEDAVQREMHHAEEERAGRAHTYSSHITTEVIKDLAENLGKSYLEARAMVMAEVDKRRNAITTGLSSTEREELTQLLAPLAAGQPELLSKDDARRINELMQLLLPPEEGR